MTKTAEFDRSTLTNAQKQCLDLVESLGIYELRALARVFGDNSPTTLKRADHIRIVMQKIISGEELRPIPLRQGRPFKELSNIEGILKELSDITGNDYCLKNNQVFKKVETREIVFHQEEASVIEQKLFAVEAKGILQNRNEDEFYFVDQETNRVVLVKKSIDQRLKAFDFVVGTAVIMNENKDYILDQVTYINYIPQGVYTAQERGYGQPADKSFSFKEKDFPFGSRFLLKTSKFLDDPASTKALTSTFVENRTVCVALVPNVFPEDVLTYQKLGFSNSVLLRYDQKLSDAENAIKLVLGHVNRLQALGLSVALFVEDIVTFANLMDAYSNKETSVLGHSEEVVEKIRQLYLLPKNGGSAHTSIITTFDELDLSDQMYVSLIYKISKKLN